MKLVRKMFDDLVEKRLWPVAILLVAALVAVPVLLTKSAASTSGPSVNVPSTPKLGPLASATPAVDIVQPDAAKRLTHLSKRNPFTQLHLPKIKKEAAPKAASSSGAASTGSAGGSTGGTGTTGGAGTTTHPTTTYTVTSLDLRFGKANGRSVRHDLARLAPLPTAGNPVLIYMGLLKDNKSAVFLISSDAQAEGDGTCHPSPSNCQTVHMNAGETEFFDVTTASGAIVQYQLELLKVKVTKTTSAKTAKAASVRVSKAGRKALRKYLHRSGSTSVSNLRYDAGLGHLVSFRAPKAASWRRLGLGGH